MSKKETAVCGYETTIISKNEMTDDIHAALVERFKNTVSTFGGGEVIVTEDWGKKKLAYPIQKETRGRYTYIAYTGRGGLVAELERQLRIHDHVIRFLTVNLGQDFDGAAFLKKRQTSAAAPEQTEQQ